MDGDTKKRIGEFIIKNVPKSSILIFILYLGVLSIGRLTYITLTENDKLAPGYVENVTNKFGLAFIAITILFIIACLIFFFLSKRKKIDIVPDGKIDAFVVAQDADARDEKFKKINKDVKKTYWVLGVGLTSMVTQEPMLKRMANDNIRIRLCMMDPDIIVEDLCLNSFNNNACNLKDLMEKIKTDQIEISDLKKEFENLENCKDMLEIYHILINVFHFKEYYDTDTDYKNTIKISCKNLKEIRSTIVREHDQYSFELGIADSFMPMSLTIVDAEEEFGRMIVEFHLPFMQYRVLFEINKKDNEDLFGVFVKFYKIVWERADKSE